MMPERYTVVVPGRPVPKKAMRRGQRFVDDRAQRTLDYQRAVGLCALAAKVPRFAEPVSLTVRAYFRDDRRPDLKNVVAAAEDGLEVAGILRNDRQVVRYGEGTGIYFDPDERLEIEIEVIGR